MKIIKSSSLAATIENLNDVFLSGKKLSPAEKKDTASFIASRQGLPGSYANMFAPTEKDFKGVRLMTGENLTTKAGISHILGEESQRALYLLGTPGTEAKQAASAAKKGIKKAIKFHMERGYYSEGFYCCGKCTVAYWRNLSAEGTRKNKRILNAGLKILKAHRDGKGKWKRFPYWYTALALTGISLPAAKEELKYAEGALIRVLRKRPGNSDFGRRRHAIAAHAMEILS